MVKVIRHDSNSTPTRFGVALITALLITMVLLFLMQVLIATGKSAVVENRVGDLLEFVRVPRVEEPPVPEETIKRPDKPEDQPRTPQPEQQLLESTGDPFYLPPMDHGGQAPRDLALGPGIGGDLLPILKVAPIYPERLAARGIEGHVILEYTVTGLGTVINVTVVESTHSGFENAAINSALKYKYKPKYINGEPVAVHGVQTLIRFQLED